MWVHLPNWIVQDGEIPELKSGSILQDHAIRASCWSIQSSTRPEGVAELSRLDTSADGSPHYDLTGTVEWGREPSKVLLSAGEFQVLAEPISVRQVPGTSWEDNLVERFAPDFFVPPLGTRATVRCRLDVMADYETEDDIGAPGLVRSDWVVRRLRIQHRALSRVPGQERTWTVGNVVRVEDIERMHRWADEKDHHPITYLLDLQLPT